MILDFGEMGVVIEEEMEEEISPLPPQEDIMDSPGLSFSFSTEFSFSSNTIFAGEESFSYYDSLSFPLESNQLFASFSTSLSFPRWRRLDHIIEQNFESTDEEARNTWESPKFHLMHKKTEQPYLPKQPTQINMGSPVLRKRHLRKFSSDDKITNASQHTAYQPEAFI